MALIAARTGAGSVVAARHFSRMRASSVGSQTGIRQIRGRTAQIGQCLPQIRSRDMRQLERDTVETSRVSIGDAARDQQLAIDRTRPGDGHGSFVSRMHEERSVRATSSRPAMVLAGEFTKTEGSEPRLHDFSSARPAMLSRRSVRNTGVDVVSRKLQRASCLSEPRSSPSADWGSDRRRSRFADRRRFRGSSIRRACCRPRDFRSEAR